MTSNMINEQSNIFELKEKYMIKKVNLKLAKKIGLADYEAYRLTNWAKINNKYYYIKQSRGLNEMLGELIASELDLKTAHYEPISYYNNLYFRSPNFREKNKTYNRISYYTQNDNEDLLDDFKNIKTYKELKEDILKLYALDLYMKQTDRGEVNILLEQDKDNIRLAPIYDYSAAYMTSNKYFNEYYNYIYTIKINEIDKALNKYPELEKNIEQLLKIDFLKKLKQEVAKYRLTFTDTINNFYETSFEETHKMLNKIIKG